MGIGTDFTIDYVNKRITHYSGSTVYEVNELYTYLMNEFDELAQMDDTIPMSAQTPNAYTLLNGWFMDDNSFKYLKEGAVITSGWASGGIRLISYNTNSGTHFDTDDIGGTITGTITGDTGKVLAYDVRYGTKLGVVWIRPTDPVADNLFNDNDEAFTVSTGAAGSFTATFNAAGSDTGENLWTNVYTLGTIQSDDSETIYIVQNGVKLTGWWPALHIDVLIKVQEAGDLINSGIITVFLRHYPDALPSRGNADLYDNFEINLASGGRNAVPLATSPDLNNVTDAQTVDDYFAITIAFVNGTVPHDSFTGTFVEYDDISWPGGTGVSIKDTSGTMTIGNVTGDNGPLDEEVITGTGWSCTANNNMTVAKTVTRHFEQGTDKNYSICINCATLALALVYEYLKYVTREAINEEPFQCYPTKYLNPTLSIDKKDGEQYISAFRDFTTPGNTYSAVKASPFGTFAGGTFFGARGVWIENMAAADIQKFQLTDSDNVAQNPPNFQSITITNLLADDRVSVFKTEGIGSTVIEKDTYTAGVGNVTASTTFVVSETIATDTPSSGVIRAVDTSDISSNRETRYTYTSWATSTFQISGTLGKEYTQTTDTAYVPFIDTTATTTSATVQVIFTTNRPILIRVRRYAPADPVTGPILPFQTTDTFGSTGYSTAAIRTLDLIVG